MIDGVKCTCAGLHPDVWKQNKLLNFCSTYNHATGEIGQRASAKFQSINFTVSENGSSSINGSLHKYYNADNTNYNDFHFQLLSQALNSLNLNFSIDLNTAKINALEIGVNIELPFSPETIINSLICHKKRNFYPIDKDNEKLGLYCNHSEYVVKIYDKGKQDRGLHFLKDIKLLRYEIKIKKQRMLKPYGIKYLSDLQDKGKVSALIRLLLDKLNEIVFFDFGFNASHLNERKRLKWRLYASPNFWNGKDKEKARYERIQYNKLIKQYGCIDFNALLSEKVADKWSELLNVKAEKYPTFSPLEYNGEKVGVNDLKEKEKEKKFVARFCKSCGREITGQKAGSLFCSEKVYGHTAKQCRNKDSNKRLAIKRKITRAMTKDLPVTVTYTNNTTNCLKVSEIRYNRALFDCIVKVKAMKPEILKQVRMKSKQNRHEKSPP
jgi:hypothetical protein